MLSHDLRGRLSAALMSVDLLRQQIANLPQEAREDVATLRSALLDCLFRLTQLTTLERLRLGSVPMRPVAVDLGGLAAGLRTRYAEACEMAGVGLTVEGRGSAVTDGHLFEHLVANLLDNAVRHARATRLGCLVVGEGSGWWVEVSDDGVGLPPGAVEVLRAAEMPGFHPDGGVGLRLVRGLAGLLGATVVLEGLLGSVEGPRLGGRGTVIRVGSSLPMRTTDNPR